MSRLFLLLLLFAGSGCAALVYEIVWFQMLELVIGSSAVSLGVLLGTFMGGMCLGSLMLPRVVPRQAHPLRVWAILEAGIGVFGILVHFSLPWLAHGYVAWAPHGVLSLLLRGLLCALCLLPSTVLLGASFPALARYLDVSRGGVSNLGALYGGNIGGGVVGSLLTGFWLLRLHDVAIATYFAAALNVSISVCAALLAQQKSEVVVERSAETPSVPRSELWRVYWVIAFSGFCALVAEVVWTRLLALMLGPTVYTFAIILAVFLIGLGIGSVVGARLVRDSGRPAALLGGSQLLAVLAIAWAAWMLSKSLPYWPINHSLSRNLWFTLQLDLLRSLWAILPATCLWGASFPLALAAATEPGQDPGRLVARIYTANTAGAIAGALTGSLLLIAWLGTQNTQRAIIGLSALSGLLMLIPSRSLVAASEPWRVVWGPRLPGLRIALLGAAALLIGVAWAVPAVPWGLIAYGRNLPTMTQLGTMLYSGEGMNASVAVSEWADATRMFHVSGKVEASTAQKDMRLQRMLGHVPALFHPEPRSVLVVGCGAGVTAGSFVLHPSIERIVICEIEPLIPSVVAHFFRQENYDVLQDPRVVLVYDDARHFILTTREKFDIITSDPIHPWVKGAATLYTKEYFELCKKHLNAGGLITQWLPLYESNSHTIKTALATFFSVFPEGTLWGNDDLGQGYDVVLLGQRDSLQINIDDLQQRLHAPDYRLVEQSLGEIGLKSAFGLLTTYSGQGPDLEPWLRDGEINRDANLRLQYLAGMVSGGGEPPDTIYRELLQYCRFPTQKILGSSTWTRALAKAIDRPSSKN
jgi:spermidine synthase